jgi:hypothetical protein
MAGYSTAYTRCEVCACAEYQPVGNSEVNTLGARCVCICNSVTNHHMATITSPIQCNPGLQGFRLCWSVVAVGFRDSLICCSLSRCGDYSARRRVSTV